MFKKTAVVLSVAGFAAGAAALPEASAKAPDADGRVQVAAGACSPCNPCAAESPCSSCEPCAAKSPCSPCNPCAASSPCNPCNPCNPCAAD